MAFVSEFLTYLFKAIILGLIAFAGIKTGAAIKKSKAAKASPDVAEEEA